MNQQQPRIFCIGKNYDAHINELGSIKGPMPVIFMKPWTSLLPVGAPITMPQHGADLHHEVELVVQIGATCKDIAEVDAQSIISGWTLGLDLTLRDIQNAMKQEKGPWETAKAFDGSAPMGEMIPYTGAALDNIELTCRVDSDIRQQGNTRDMIVSVPALIAYLSSIWQLLPGDLIMTGTPPGVGPLHPGACVSIESPTLGVWSWQVTA